jgi:integrase
MFQDITPSFLIKYERHLREVHDNTTNTINKDMKFIRKIFNDAYRLDIIEHNQNPFLKYKMKLEKTQRTFLTEEELKLIEDFQTSPGSRLEMHRDMFVFASYTGLRVSDVLQLRWKNFDGTHIHFTMKKTGQQLSIKLPNVANEIIRRYSPNKNSPGQFIFPALPEDFDMKDLRRLDTEISRATAYVNKNLKIIAQRVGIDKNLSFHVGRHTFATRAIAKDIPIQIVMSTMGHTNPRETLIYAKILNAARDKAMDAFND